MVGAAVGIGAGALGRPLDVERAALVGDLCGTDAQRAFGFDDAGAVGEAGAGIGQ